MTLLAQQIRNTTRELHDAIEANPFQIQLAQATLPLAAYTAYLGQLYIIHQALEDRLALANGLFKWHAQKQFLQEDLDHLGIKTVEIKPTPATCALLDQIMVATAPSLLGFYYVLLGSKHGAKFLAPNLKKRFQFAEHGTRYFDPYGDQFHSMWREFIEAVNEIQFSDAQKEEVVQAARIMFQSITQMSSQLAIANS